MGSRYFQNRVVSKIYRMVWQSFATKLEHVCSEFQIISCTVGVVLSSIYVVDG